MSSRRVIDCGVDEVVQLQGFDKASCNLNVRTDVVRYELPCRSANVSHIQPWRRVYCAASPSLGRLGGSLPCNVCYDNMTSTSHPEELMHEFHSPARESQEGLSIPPNMTASSLKNGRSTVLVVMLFILCSSRQYLRVPLLPSQQPS